MTTTFLNAALCSSAITMTDYKVQFLHGEEGPYEDMTPA